MTIVKPWKPFISKCFSRLSPNCSSANLTMVHMCMWSVCACAYMCITCEALSPHYCHSSWCTRGSQISLEVPLLWLKKKKSGENTTMPYWINSSKFYPSFQRKWENVIFLYFEVKVKKHFLSSNLTGVRDADRATETLWPLHQVCVPGLIGKYFVF